MIVLEALLLAALQTASAASAARPQAAQPVKPASAAPAPSFTLTVRGGIDGRAEIAAKQVEAKAIIERLKSQLRIPINATAVVAQHKVDLTLKDVGVTRILTALAPFALADIEVGAAPEDTVWKAIHLLAYNEKEPPRAIRQIGVLVGAGDTEDDTVTPEDLQARADKEAAKGLEKDPEPEKPMLSVAVTEGRVSIRARKQNVAALLNEVAIRAGVPFDIRGAIDTIPIDIEIRDLPLRDLPLALGRASARVMVRRDLATGNETVQGILFGDTRPQAVR